MYIKTPFLFLASMAIASYGKASCPAELRSNGAFKNPTNIVTSKAIPANTTSPVILFDGIFNYFRVKNLGDEFEAYPNEVVDMTSVTGGVLCNKIYKLHNLRFAINPNGRGRSGNTVNGKGTPLEIDFVYYNVEYLSMNNALNKTDGILVITFRISTGPTFNPLFIPFQFLLSLGVLKEPGSQMLIPSAVVCIWFDIIAFVAQYYAFPGTHVDSETGETYPALRIIPHKPIAYISYSQFAAFRNIHNEKGEAISTVKPLNPFGGRKLVIGNGFGQFAVPL